MSNEISHFRYVAIFGGGWIAPPLFGVGANVHRYKVLPSEWETLAFIDITHGNIDTKVNHLCL